MFVTATQVQADTMYFFVDSGLERVSAIFLRKHAETVVFVACENATHELRSLPLGTAISLQLELEKVKNHWSWVLWPSAWECICLSGSYVADEDHRSDEEAAAVDRAKLPLDALFLMPCRIL